LSIAVLLTTILQKLAVDIIRAAATIQAQQGDGVQGLKKLLYSAANLTSGMIATKPYGNASQPHLIQPRTTQSNRG
jgi:hypothetical protein